MGLGTDAQLGLGPQSIHLDPRSQLALLDRRAALWSGKNPLRTLKQSSGHHCLIARAYMSSGLSQLSGGPCPPPTWIRCGLCLGAAK